MDDIVSIKNTRILPISLDIKTNVGKSSSEILSRLQSGSNLRAVVIKSDNSGEVIFNTIYGRFSAANYYNLTIGDSVNFKISNLNGEIEGNIKDINGRKIDSTQTSRLTLIRPIQISQNPSVDNADKNYITLNDIINTPKVISGIISYLNLNNIAGSSPLFKMINNAFNQSGSNPRLFANVLPSDHIPTAAYTFDGIVSSSSKAGGQLIKTDFGIITTHQTKMPIGQKLLLELTGLNDRLISNELTGAVTDFVHRLNNNDVYIKNFINPLAIFLAQKEQSEKLSETESTKKLKYETSDSEKKIVEEPKKRSLSSESIIKSLNALFKDNEEIKKLVAEYRLIKELLTPFEKEQTDISRWQTIFIPFYDGRKLIEQKIKIDLNNEQQFRFVFNLDFTSNQIQIEGLVGFESDAKTLKTFNMILRSKIRLDPEICKKIADIYYTSQIGAGLRGTLSIEGFNQFIQT